MGYIPYNTMKKLQSVGFSFPDYEHFLNLGMVYYYQDKEYIIGRFESSEYSDVDKLAAKEGCWLPTEGQLIEWLCLVDIDFTITWDVAFQCFYIQAVDTVNRAQYSAKGKVLAYTLANLIYQVCKSDLREYLPNAIIRLEIE